MRRLTLFILLLTAHILSAQTGLIETRYGAKKKTIAKVTAVFDKLPASGYMPILVELKNANKTDKTWTLTFVSKGSDDGYRRDEQVSKMSSEFTCSCPAGQSKSYTLIVPVLSIIPNAGMDSINSSLEVSLSTGGVTNRETLTSTQFIEEPATLVSSHIFSRQSHEFDSNLRTSYYGYGGSRSETTSSFEPKQLPSDWRAYVGYDAMICTDTDWKAMSSSTRNAVLEWNRLGGRLIICAIDSKSDLKTLDIDKNSPKKQAMERSFGSVKIVAIPGGIDKMDIAQICRFIQTPYANTPKAESNRNDFGGKNDSSNTYSSGPEWPLQKIIGNKDFNPLFFIIILIIFGILVGPVNLFVFAKSGRRHRLFITTPIISLVASALLLVMIILQDGFGGKGQRVQLIEIDPTENKSYVLQEQLTRTGIVLGSSFETSVPTYITPVPMEQSRFSRVTLNGQAGNANFTVEHGENGYKTEGDWFQSRSEYGHYLESVISTRGKLTLKSTAGAPVLYSSFDFPLQSVLYHSKDGEWWITENLESGDSAKFSKITTSEARKIIQETRNTMTDRLAERFTRLVKRTDHFIALTKDAPGIETLDSITWEKTHTVLTGAVVR